MFIVKMYHKYYFITESMLNYCSMLTVTHLKLAIIVSHHSLIISLFSSLF